MVGGRVLAVERGQLPGVVLGVVDEIFLGHGAGRLVVAGGQRGVGGGEGGGEGGEGGGQGGEGGQLHYALYRRGQEGHVGSSGGGRGPGQLEGQVCKSCTGSCMVLVWLP